MPYGDQLSLSKGIIRKSGRVHLTQTPSQPCNKA